MKFRAVRLISRFSRGLAVLVVAAFLQLLTMSAFASGSGVTYHGRILKPDGSALEGMNVQFKLQIRTPGSENCLMFEETQTLNMKGTQGLFSLSINDGHGTRTDAYGGTYSLEQALSNRGTFSYNAGDCGIGNTYTPSSTDQRRLVVLFKDETMATLEAMPAQTLAYAPMAIAANYVGGFAAGNLLRVESGAGPQPAAALTPANFAELIALLSGTSTRYLASSTSSGAVLPVVSGAPASPALGAIWYDSGGSGSIKYFDGTSAQTIAGGGGGTGTVTSVTAGAGLTGGTITSSGTIAIAAGGVGSLQLATSAVTSAKLDPAINISTSGNVSAPNVSSNVDSTKQILLYQSGGGTKLSLTVPALGADYALTFPANAGTNGQFLTSNGAGAMAWTSPSASGLTSLNGLVGNVQTFSAVGTSGTAPGFNSSGTTHTLNIPMASSGGVTAGLLSKTDYDAFATKQTAALADGKIWIGNSAGIATAVTPTGDLSFANTGASTLTSIRGQAVSATAPSSDGQVLRWNSTTNWTPGFLSMADVRSTVTIGNTIFPTTPCTTNKTLIWASLTDTFTCVLIGIADAQITYGAKGVNLVLAGPASGGAAAPLFRALTAADLPAGIVSQWITSGATISYTIGSVGIGTAAPAAGVALDVYGTGALASAMLLPRDSTAARPTGLNGMLRYNTTSAGFEGYAGGAWMKLGSPWNSGASNSINYVVGSVGIGTTLPTGVLDVEGGTAAGSGSGTSVTINAQNGGSTGATNGGNIVLSAGTANGAGTAGNIQLNTSKVVFPSLGASVLTQGVYGMFTGNTGYGGPSIGTTDIVSYYGINLVTGYAGVAKTPNLTINSAGSVGIGTAAPTTGALVEFFGTGSTQSSVLLPRDNSGSRPNGVNGMLRYNTTLNKLESYENGLWTSYATSAGASASGIAGAVQFSDGSGGFVSDATKFYFNNATKRLGIGSGSPQAALDVNGAIALSGLNAISFPSTDTTPGGSLAIGAGALANQNALAAGPYYSTAIGYHALGSAGLTSAATANTAVGFGSLASNTSGMGNSATGLNSLSQNTTGSSNAAFGQSALNNNAAGASNTAVGYAALYASTGNNNTALGNYSGHSITSGGSNTVLGYNVASSTLATGSNNILIGTGSGTDTPTASTSNFLNVGNIIFATNIVGTVTTPVGAVGIGTVAPGAALDVYSLGAQSAIVIPRDSTTARPVGINGMIRYNTTLNRLEAYEGNAWTSYLSTQAGVPFVNGRNSFAAAATLGTDDNFGLSLYTSGASRMTIDTAGNVGVGTTLPGARIDAFGSGTTAINVSNSTTNHGITDYWPTNTGAQLTAYNNGTGELDGVGGNGTTPALNIVGAFGSNTPTSTVPAIKLLALKKSGTAAVGLGANETVMQIKSSGTFVTVLGNGNTGVGTALPVALLDVYGTGAQSAVLVPRDTSSSRPVGVNGMIRYNTTSRKLESYENNSWTSYVATSGASAAFTNGANSFGTAATLGTNDIYPLSLYTSGASRMTIDTAGNVGIGTTSPSAALQVVQASNASSMNGLNLSGSGTDVNLSLNNSGAGGLAWFIDSVGNGGGFPAGSLVFGNGTSWNNTVMALSTSGVGMGYLNPGTARLAVNGALGIGTTSPNTIFDVEADYGVSAGYQAISRSGRSAGNNSGILTGYYANGSNDTAGFVRSTGSTSDLILATYPGGTVTDRLHIANNGNVGVGTATPSALLDVFGTGAQSAVLVPRDTSGARPAGINGMLRYNTNLSAFEGYANGSWGALAGAGLAFPLLASPSTSTASAPSYSFAGNASTGLYSPAANTLALSTYGTAALTILPSASVVVGPLPVAPTAPLQVYDAANPSTISTGFVISKALDTFDMGESLDFRLKWSNGTWYTPARIVALDQSGYGGKLAFYTKPANGAEPGLERMRIGDNGFVGIGTSSPAAMLDVYGTGYIQSAMLVPRDTSANRPTGVNGMLRYNTSMAALETFANNAWTNISTGQTQWTTSGASLLYNPSGGGVGIGTGPTTISSSATYFPSILPIFETGYGNTQSLAVIRNYNTTGAAMLRQAGLLLKLSNETSASETAKMGGMVLESSAAWSAAPNLNFVTNEAPRMSITSAGNVGIGTTAPVSLLHVTAAVTAPVLTLQNTTANNYTMAAFVGTGRDYRIGTANASEVGFGVANKFFIFDNTAAQMRLVVDASGAVGIGSTTPTVGSIADFNGAGTGLSSIVLPRDTTANRPVIGVNGMIRYNTTSATVEAYANGNWASAVSQWNSGASSSINYTAGYVGIGTTAPGSLLEINQANGAAYMPLSVAGNTPAAAFSALPAFGGISFTGNMSAGWGEIDIVNRNTAGSPRGFSFIQQTGTGTFTYPFRIEGTTGNVGIGTASPGNKLSVEASTDYPVSFTTTNTNGAGMFSHAGNFLAPNLSAGEIYTLNVGQSTTNNNSAYFGYVHNSGNSTTNYLTMGMWSAGAGNQVLNITAAGNVGVGTTSPAALLDVYGTGAQSAVIVPRDTSGNRPSGVSGMIRYNTTSGRIEAYESGTWTSYATSASSQWNNGASSSINYIGGNVGVGTTTPASRLDVNGDISILGLKAITLPTSELTAGGSVGVGAGALAYQNTLANTDFQNTALGHTALGSSGMTTTSQYNTAIGANVLAYNTTGAANTGVGQNTLYVNSSGDQNTALGTNALQNNATGSYNTGIGVATLYNATGASNNVALGHYAGRNVTSGASNLLLGYHVATTTLTTGSSNILIGTSSQVDTPASGTSNFLNIGNLIFGTGVSGTLAAPLGNIGIGTNAPAAKLDVAGHIANSGGAAALGACGTGPTLAGNDARGTVTVGSGSPASCAINFASAYASAPFCVVSGFGASPGGYLFVFSATTNTLTIKSSGTLSSGLQFTYMCTQ